MAQRVPERFQLRSLAMALAPLCLSQSGCQRDGEKATSATEIAERRRPQQSANEGEAAPQTRRAIRKPHSAIAETLTAQPSDPEDFCTKSWGHRNFSLLVMAYNGYPADKPLPHGAVLKTPPLEQMFSDAGLDPFYEPVIGQIINAWEDYVNLLPQYKKERDLLQTDRSITQIELKPETAAELRRIRGGILVAEAALSKPIKGYPIPSKALGQFKQAMEQLAELADGKVDSEHYDTDLVGQRTARGLTNVWWWGKEGQR